MGSKKCLQYSEQKIAQNFLKFAFAISENVNNEVSENEKNKIDADAEFLENRIIQYEKLFKLKHNKNWWN